MNGFRCPVLASELLAIALLPGRVVNSATVHFQPLETVAAGDREGSVSFGTGESKQAIASSVDEQI